MSEQQLGSIAFDRPKNTNTTTTELETEYRVVPSSNANEIKLQQYLTFDPDNVPQVDTVTIALGTPGDYLTVEVDDGTTNETYTYRQSADDNTVAVVASKLAKRIDLHPGVRAIATGSTITLTGVIPGLPIAYDNAESSNTGNVAITNVTAPTGTPNWGLVTEAIAKFEVVNGFMKVTLTGSFYDGAATPAQVNALGPVTSKSSITIDEIQTSRGVARSE